MIFAIYTKNLTGSNYVKLLTSIPSAVAKLLPPSQLEHTLHYCGIYAEAIDRLYSVICSMPKTVPGTVYLKMMMAKLPLYLKMISSLHIESRIK